MIAIPKIRRTLLMGVFLLAAGSLAIHLTLHSPFHPPVGQRFTNSLASFFALLDAVLVTFLFSRKKTAAWGYLLNGLLVIYGTVLMTHFGQSHSTLFKGFPLSLLYHATTPEIIIAWADFCAGAVLYRLWFMEPAVKED